MPDTNQTLGPPTGIFLSAARLAVIPSLIVIAKIFWPLEGWYDRFHYVVGRDFSNFWMAAALSLHGRVGEIYDIDAYLAAMRLVFSPEQPIMNFSYPPHALVVLAPLGLLPYGAALGLWLSASAAAVVHAAFGASAARLPRAWWALLLVSPCVLFALSIAQATCLLALLFIGCLRLAPTRPWAAGLLLGVLSIKPHLCVLIGLVLIVRRQWPVLIAAAGTVLTLAGLSVALFGTGPWLDYVVHTIPYQRLVLEQPFGFVWALMVSPYAWFMQCGVPVGVAALLHMIVAAAIAAVALIASEIARRRRDDDLAIAILALGTVLITPYSLIYDLVIPTAAMFGYLAHTRAAPSRRVTITLALFWAAPMAIMVLAERALPAALPLMLAAFAALCAPALASASLEFGALAGRMRARAVPR